MLAQVEAADGSLSDVDRAADDTPAARQYRIGELAREAGIGVRTVRYYQERKLLPPPRRQGRIGWYSQAHLSRLKVIGQLLDRGHTLSGIGQLLSAWEQGYDLADLLGFERAMTAPWSDEEPVPVTVADISALLAGQLTPEVLAEAIRLGYIDVDGERVTHVSRRLLDTTTALVRAGIPLPAILATGRELQARLDKLASLFMELVITPALAGGGARPRGPRSTRSSPGPWTGEPGPAMPSSSGCSRHAIAQPGLSYPLTMPVITGMVDRHRERAPDEAGQGPGRPGGGGHRGGTGHRRGHREAPGRS
jgi:DNA-binding transcriptional MerR regulator